MLKGGNSSSGASMIKNPVACFFRLESHREIFKMDNIKDNIVVASMVMDIDLDYVGLCKEKLHWLSLGRI